MKKHRWIIAAILLAGFGAASFVAGRGYSQAPNAEGNAAFLKRVAKKWGLKEEEVSKKLQELGQEIQQELSSGRTADIPGLGTFQVVSVHPHREIRDGKSVVVKENTVQIRPAPGLASAANGPGARPVEEIAPPNFLKFRGSSGRP